MTTSITINFESVDDLNSWFDNQCIRCCLRNCEWQNCDVCEKSKKYEELIEKLKSKDKIIE